MQQITPTTMIIVGSVLIGMPALIYLVSRFKPPEEKDEEYITDMNNQMDARFYGRGGKTKRQKRKKQTCRK